MIIMALTLGVMLLVLTGWFGPQRLARLARLKFQGGMLVALACLVQVVSIHTQQYQLVWLLLSAAFLAWFCWLNRCQPGIVLAAVGIALNMLVMAANGGTMPVNPEAVAQALNTDNLEAVQAIPLTKGTLLDDGTAALHWLGDRLLLPGPLARIAAWSIGDVLLIAGIGWLLWHTMKGHSYDRSTVYGSAAS